MRILCIKFKYWISSIGLCVYIYIVKIFVELIYFENLYMENMMENFKLINIIIIVSKLLCVYPFLLVLRKK